MASSLMTDIRKTSIQAYGLKELLLIGILIDLPNTLIGIFTKLYIAPLDYKSIDTYNKIFFLTGISIFLLYLFLVFLMQVIVELYSRKYLDKILQRKRFSAFQKGIIFILLR